MREHVHLLTRLGDVLGEANPSVAASLGQISAQLASVRHRDALGEAVVNGLSDWYDQVAVMTLNGPRAVLWRCSRAGAPNEALVGRAVDIVEGGVMARATQERVFYYGPLPAASKLRDGLGITHGRSVLVAPIDMRGKTILLLALDPGAGAPWRSPGSHLERLLVDLAKGLERVILLRRRGRRK